MGGSTLIAISPTHRSRPDALLPGSFIHISLGYIQTININVLGLGLPVPLSADPALAGILKDAAHFMKGSRPNKDGGTHLTGFRSALTKAVNQYAKANGLIKEKDPAISGDDVRQLPEAEQLRMAMYEAWDTISGRRDPELRHGGRKPRTDQTRPHLRLRHRLSSRVAQAHRRGRLS